LKTNRHIGEQQRPRWGREKKDEARGDECLQVGGQRGLGKEIPFSKEQAHRTNRKKREESKAEKICKKQKGWRSIR